MLAFSLKVSINTTPQLDEEEDENEEEEDPSRGQEMQFEQDPDLNDGQEVLVETISDAARLKVKKHIF